jgi:hypothetical protein
MKGPQALGERFWYSRSPRLSAVPGPSSGRRQLRERRLLYRAETRPRRQEASSRGEHPARRRLPMQRGPARRGGGIPPPATAASKPAPQRPSARRRSAHRRRVRMPSRVRRANCRFSARIRPAIRSRAGRPARLRHARKGPGSIRRAGASHWFFNPIGAHRVEQPAARDGAARHLIASHHSCGDRRQRAASDRRVWLSRHRSR